jgi:hypothetical protein
MSGMSLVRLETAIRFHRMCYQLARRRFPVSVGIVVGMRDLWDDATRIIQLPAENGHGDVLWQSVFTSDPLVTRASVKAGLRCFDRSPQRKPRYQTRLVLCVPPDPDDAFLRWVARAAGRYNVLGEVWGETILTGLLDQAPDIMQSFFFNLQQQGMSQPWRTSDELELVKFEIDSACQWRKPDTQVLHFSTKSLLISPDLVFDVVLRNAGNADTMLTGLIANVRDCHPVLHGYPEYGFLLPKIEYKVSIGHGQPGDYEEEFNNDQWLLLKAGQLARFKIRLVDTGYAWSGAVRLVLRHGKNGRFAFPWFRLSA